MLVEGKTCTRATDIHGVYRGQKQGGISTPKHHPLVLILTGHSGKQRGYADGWVDDDTFLCAGEGQVGDMTFAGGTPQSGTMTRMENSCSFLRLWGKASPSFFGAVLLAKVGTGFRRADQSGVCRFTPAARPPRWPVPAPKAGHPGRKPPSVAARQAGRRQGRRAGSTRGGRSN